MQLEIIRERIVKATQDEDLQQELWLLFYQTGDIQVFNEAVHSLLNILMIKEEIYRRVKEFMAEESTINFLDSLPEKEAELAGLIMLGFKPTVISTLMGMNIIVIHQGIAVLGNKIGDFYGIKATIY